MEKRRLLELALKSLAEERARIDAEIAQIQSQLKPAKTRKRKTVRKKTGRKLTAAQRKKLSQQMKKNWKQRKAAQKVAESKSK